MKKVTTTLLASAGLFFASTSWAALQTPPPNYTFTAKHYSKTTELYGSQQAAYDAGVVLLANLQAASPQELKAKFNVIAFDPTETNSIELKDGAEISTKVIIDEQGDTRYQGVVNVGYQYLKRDQND
ncbi:DUF3316 domain-containing protein [Vibrio vulnificus]|nr:DUF3316 domain-containing protein [Vibrio vulnificus]EHZ2756024.1 DUF3316 domain-containing protein [Vibrio vulnificus]EHZ2765098.1 DUF3316 domain-containing protein [Vibrio vulnificus]EKD8804921.1 DUF3316 domain-containing protein [Vibrio vulnificus]EKD9323219.1 DUF3316 domain-containing protein [Vibrio vulnificus]